MCSKMSLNVKVGSKTMNITTTNVCDIDELVKHVRTGCELSVFLYDATNTNFHEYVFDYLPESPLCPRGWLLNNIGYAITCKETAANMTGLFTDILNKLQGLM